MEDADGEPVGHRDRQRGTRTEGQTEGDRWTIAGVRSSDRSDNKA